MSPRFCHVGGCVSCFGSDWSVRRLNYCVDSLDYLQHSFTGERPNELLDTESVDGKELRDQDHALLWQIGLPRIQQNVSRGASQSQVCGNGADNCCFNAASIERVALHNNTRPGETRFRSHWRARVEPVNIAVVHFHSASFVFASW